MRTLKFMKVDFIKSRRTNLIFMALGIGAGFIVANNSSRIFSYLTGLLYVMFFGSVLASTAFAEGNGRNMSERTAFALLLPGSAMQRIGGRLLYGICAAGALGAVYVACALLVGIGGGVTAKQAVMAYLVAMGFAVLLVDVQYLICYLAGQNSTGVILSLLRIVLPMGVYFGVAGILEDIEDNGIQYGFLTDAAAWLGEHIAAGIAGLLLFAAAWSFVSVLIVTWICSRRDYA